MKIVVDSNIIFSALLNSTSRIGQLLIIGTKYFDYYSVDLKANKQSNLYKTIKLD